MSVKKLSYGECPDCGEGRQPPDTPELVDGAYHEYCYCCDCQIMWMIITPEAIAGDEPHLHTYEIYDIESFDDTFTPYDC